jgi:hypothetical protein
MSTARSLVMLAWLVLTFFVMPVSAHQIALALFILRAYLVSHGIENEKSIFKLVA